MSRRAAFPPCAVELEPGRELRLAHEGARGRLSLWVAAAGGMGSFGEATTDARALRQLIAALERLRWAVELAEEREARLETQHALWAPADRAHG